jgi:S1-C subfamily serine protease
VQSVTPGGPAEKAGIRAGDITAQLDGQPIQLGGDIITRIENKAIRTNDDLAAAVADLKRGEKVKVTLVRGGKTRTVEVKLAEQPARAPNQP